MPDVSKWMIGYGVFLVALGLIAYAISGFATAGLTAVIAGSVPGVLMVVMALLAAAKNHVAKMVGIHLGMVLMGLLALVYLFQAFNRWRGFFAEEDAVLYLPVILTIMGIGSVIALVMVIRLRPAPEKRGGEVEGGSGG